MIFSFWFINIKITAIYIRMKKTGYLKLTSGLSCGKFFGKTFNNLNNPPSIKKAFQ